MKKFLGFLLVFLCLASLATAGVIHVIGSGVSASGGSGTIIFDEQFEQTDAYGYDEVAAGEGQDWVETETGGTVDSNADVPTCTGCTDWDSDSLRVTATGTGAVRTYNYIDDQGTPDEYPTTYWRVDVLINTHANDEESINIGTLQSYASEDCLEIFFKESGSDLYLDFEVNAGTAVDDYGPISMDTSYRIDFYYSGSGAAGEWELRVAQGKNMGTTHATGSANMRTGISDIYLGLNNGDPDSTLDVYYDMFQMATDDWIPNE